MADRLSCASLVLLVTVLVTGTTAALTFIHHDNLAMEEFLVAINETYPDIVRLYSIGKTIGGRPILQMRNYTPYL